MSKALNVIQLLIGMHVLAVLVLLSSCGMSNGSDEALLRELDRCIAERERYHQPRERQVDSLKALLTDTMSHYERFEVYGRLVETYRSYNLDSQQYYTEARLRMASTPFERQVSLLNYSEVLMRSGMYHETIQYMDSALVESLTPVLEPYYSHLQRTLFGLMRDFAITDRERQTYTAITQQYREQMMSVHPAGSFLHELVRADYLYEKQEYDSALHVLQAYEQANPVEGKYEEPVFAFTRAQIYKKMGNSRQAEHYLIIASIADLQNAIREYVALRELAVLLYEQGDVERAFRYMQCAVQDATSGSERVRSIETSQLYPVINGAYLRQMQRHHILMMSLFTSVSVIVVMLIGFLLYVSRKRHQLAALNDRLAQSNDNLRQSNQIKAVYIGRYMEMASLLINRFDSWRKQLRVLANSQKYGKLEAVLNSKSFTQEQLETFYRDFDEAFLHIFPDFVEQVRELLVPEAEIRIKANERLNTDLRVLALIRLGITDSKQIADFLRYSLSTIYNSRTRMRNLARGDRDHFEEKVAAL